MTLMAIIKHAKKKGFDGYMYDTKTRTSEEMDGTLQRIASFENT